MNQRSERSERSETRAAYGEALLELGRRRPDVVVLDADLYNSTRTVHFAQAFPDRFFDLGIAEQDMVSTGAGLAASGLVPFCNSFAIFLTGRCYDQIRTQVAYPALPVKLIGSSAGLTFGADGATHQALEDLALRRALPNMTVFVPADGPEAYQATLAAAELPGPVYMRLGRYPVPRVVPEGYQFVPGRLAILRTGADVTLLATGHMVWKALEAAELLAACDRLEACVVNVSTLKPLDGPALLGHCRGAQAVFTIEEHNIIGGLGSAVAEVLAEAGFGVPLRRLGVADRFGESGTPEELLARHGLQPAQIRSTVIAQLSGAK
jgi:transketolase